MQMRGVRGRNLISAGYDPVEGVLACRFAKSGEYRYKGVPEAKFLSLCRTPYADSYFTKAIKGQYPVEKPETPPKQPKPLPPIAKVEQPRKEPAMELYLAKDGLTFEPEGHVYKLNGNRIMSLTQILDAAGLVDYSGIDAAVLSNKAAFGTKVHEYTLWYDQGELEPSDLELLKAHPKYGPRITGWLQFLEDFDFIPDLEWAEVPCAVKVNGMLYAMTIDRFGIMGSGVNGIPAIVEIKTCADREPSHQIQTAGQAVPFRGDGSVQLKRGAVYLLDKPNGSNRNYFYQEHTDRNDQKLFLASLMLTQFRINNKLLKG